MCGIAGIWFKETVRSGEDLISAVDQMTDCMLHRGPDGGGAWSDPQCALTLGHRRLAIIDLQQTGHQPMVSHDGQWVLAYNGEIYNHHQLRRELEANVSINWRGTSDTESILEYLAHFGIEKMLAAINGMFSFALWNRRTHELTLARDRIGEKPLYYGSLRDGFYFASQLEAIRSVAPESLTINRDALDGFLRYKSVPAPHSIYENVFKLLPGTFVTLKHARDIVEPKTYWSLRDVVEESRGHVLDVSGTSAVDRLDTLLSQAVAMRMESDVPLGGFLSGGIDSSVIIALMQKSHTSPVRSFSIGFHEQGYNEAEHAKAVATHLKTDHTELYVDSAQALDLIPKMHHYYDEPFADSSQIPTCLLSQLTRRHVTVSLSGDAGDELFGGYVRHIYAAGLWQRISKMPLAMRMLLHSLMHTIPRSWVHVFTTALMRVFSEGKSVTYPLDKLYKMVDMLPSHCRNDVYHRLTQGWLDCDRLVLGHHSDRLGYGYDVPDSLNDSFSARMRYWDMMTYLPNDILTKVDRASMAFSLETRIPFLDTEVIRFAWSLPEDHLIRSRQGKWILRQVLDRYVPQKLIDRPKAGFAVPIDIWLRGVLKDWASALLDKNLLVADGYLRPEPILRMWKEHLGGKRNASQDLWAVLMFQAWLHADF